MKNIVAIVLILLSFSFKSEAAERQAKDAFVEANLYQLTGSLISSNIYLSYMSIDMLFINANNYTNEEKQVICTSIEQGLDKTKKDFSQLNTFVEYESKDRFKKYVDRLYNSLIEDLKLLKQYFEDNENSSREKFLKNHKKIWKLLAHNMEDESDEKNR